MLGDPARNDAAVMLEFGVNTERDTVIGDPLTNAYANRSDLQFAPRRLHDPYADTSVAPLAINTKTREDPDDPLLELVHVAADILPAPAQI